MKSFAVLASIKRKLPSLVMAILMTACLMEQANNNFHDITPVTDVPFKINLNQFGDTVFIPTITQISYTVDNKYHMMATSVELGGKQIFSGLANNTSFYFDPTGYAPGNYDLTIYVTVKSNSGSLADNLGVEEVKVWKKLVAVIAPLPTIKINRVDSSDGILVIHWDTYTKQNFQSYTISKICNFFQCATKTITSSSISSWADSSFVGGEATYVVSLQASGKVQNGTPFIFSWVPKFYVVSNDASTNYYWEKPKFYKVTTGINFNNIIDLPVSTTTYSEGPIKYLNSPSYVDLKFKYKTGSSIVASQIVYKGKKVDAPAVIPFMYNSKDNIYYGSNVYPDRNIIMDNSFNVTATVNQKVNMAISANGNYMVSYDKDAPYQIRQINPLTLGTISNSALTAPWWPVQIANNGYLAVRSNDDLIYKLPGFVYEQDMPSATPTQFIISVLGQYYIDDNYINQYNGYHYNITPLRSLPTFNGYLLFNKDDNLILAATDGTVTLTNTATGAAIKTFSTGYKISKITYDVFSDLLFANGQYVIDLQNGAQKQVSDQPSEMTLLNGILFTPLLANGAGSTGSFVYSNAKPF